MIDQATVLRLRAVPLEGDASFLDPEVLVAFHCDALADPTIHGGCRAT